MKKTLLTTLLLTLFTTLANAQTEVVGTVSDTTGTTLPGANAVLLKASDSLLVAFGTTDNKGVFRMQNVAAGDYLLRVSYVGFERPDQPLTLTAADQYLDLGNISLYPAGFLLGGVEVTADRIPIRMRGDTMMYDAASFAVSENAVVEDLLRRLPGMTVDASGNITWRGKPISEVMINGKPFFGGNTTLLTQNLDAKAVKNVRVYDQKTDNEEITGVDDGQENITVDLETKEEFKAKAFGDVYAGYGTQDRYQAGGKAFRISDATQWGLLGTINNINKVGFSGDEISGFNRSSGQGGGYWWGGGGNQSNGLQYDGGNATGDNRSIAAGLNFGKTIGKDGQFTANYALFDRDQTQFSQTLQSFNRANDNRVIDTDETNVAGSYRHSVEMELRQKIDTTGRLRVNGNLNLLGGTTNDFSRTLVKNSGQQQEDYTVRDQAITDQSSGRIGANWNARLDREERRSYFLSGGIGFNNNQQDVDLVTDGLTDGLVLPGALINGQQFQDRLTNSLNWDVGAGYSHPLSKKWNIDIEGEYAFDQDEGDYRFDFNEDETVNLLTRRWTTFEPEVEFVYRAEGGGSFSFGTTYQLANLTLEGDEARDDNFQFLLPYVRFRKRLKRGFTSLSVYTESDAPDITQLQTIARPSVSGRVSIGNPILDPAQRTGLRGFLWYNDQFKTISANINAGVNYTDNAIGNEVTFTEGQQVFRPINVSHAWSANFNAGGNVGMSFINGEMRLNLGGFYTEGQGFVDGLSRTNTNLTLNAGTTITTELNEDSYLTAGYNINRLNNSFEDDERVSTTQIVHNLSLDFALELNPVWRFESRFNYGIYDANQLVNESQSIPDLAVQLEIRPFKKVGHYFRLSGSDLFDQNTIIRRNVGQFTTTETTATGLGRYFLGTFFYKL